MVNYHRLRQGPCSCLLEYIYILSVVVIVASAYPRVVSWASQLDDVTDEDISSAKQQQASESLVYLRADSKVVPGVNSQVQKAPEKCGYSACELGKEGFINVHIVPHSHDDVGWLHTVDQYYYGVNTDGVQYILDTVVTELLSDERRRFVYVEQAYFVRWWEEQNEDVRDAVRQLVNQGRFEFILGGWSMNDEATTHYSSIIDHHTMGLRFLEENFGECGRPRVGWQIDTFGHSREMASLFAQFGFDGLFFARIDYQDKAVRMLSRTLETIWRASESLGDQSSLFTGELFYHYSNPPGFCFQCGDAPVMDDPELEDYNVEQRISEFLAVIAEQSLSYSTNHIMFTFGDDFQYANARLNFKNIDKLIAHTNALQTNGSRVNVFYSTPSCYTLALSRINKTYTHKEDDFLPYASEPSTFWTGFYTSRPALKGYERTTNNFYQVCKQLAAVAQLPRDEQTRMKILAMGDAMGIVQHHDAVSGTEKQVVADDYAKRLYYGISQCQDVVRSAYRKLLPRQQTDEVNETMPPTVQFCILLNISYCAVTEDSDQFAAIIYNPYAHDVQWWVRVPVVGTKYMVIDPLLVYIIDNDLVPLTASTLRIPERRASRATAEVVFLANLTALGFTTFFFKRLDADSSTRDGLQSYDDNSERDSADSSASPDADFTIRNEHLSATFDGKTGLMKSMTNIDKSVTIDVTQTLGYYESQTVSEPTSNQYIFRPVDSTVHAINKGIVRSSVYQGKYFQEVRQDFGEWASQVVRLYTHAHHLEIEWTIGPIDIDDKVSKEIITRYTTSLKTEGTFYTDSNGREILRRKRDYRPTWRFYQTEPVAGNYYPVNSRIYIQDTLKNIQFTVLTDRSLGGTSINDGQIELMLHRRVLTDSLDETSLNETGVDGKGLIVRGKQYIILDAIANSAQHHRDGGQQLFLAPQPSFVPLSMTPEQYFAQFNTVWSALHNNLPPNVHILTLEQWDADALLLRLEHFYGKNEDAQLSQPATVHLKDLFEPFAIRAVNELTLGANQQLDVATRLQWTVQDFGRTARDMKSFVSPVDPTKLEVVLNPMQIRTFQISLTTWHS